MAEQSPIAIKRTPMLHVINGVGSFLKTIKLNPFTLNAEKIIQKAKKKAAYEGEIPQSFREGLYKLVDSINEEANVNSFGELALKTLLGRTLYQRLKIEQAFQQDPSINEIPIKSPIFIIGMPRTGTTILHALMHEDPIHRSPLAWECLLPYPVPNKENFKDNPQLRTVGKEFQQLFQLIPDFKKKHHMEVNSPQECLGINALDATSFQTTAQVYIPSYMHWFNNESDQLQTMRFHKRFLQYLASGGTAADRWLLKSPVHLFRLEEIFAVYPDARIIMTHRHPTKVVPSASSLIASVRSLYSNQEDIKRTGAEQSKLWSDYFNRFLDARKKLNKEDQILDLKFEDFVKNQLGVVQQIYDHFGWELSSVAKENMQTFLDQNPKDKYGAHYYTLKDFGLTKEGINEQFHNYIQFLETL